MYLDKQHPKPVYLQLKETLQNQIEQGYYLAHQQLPSERDLCQQHDLSRMTARRALKALVADGLAYTQAGKGTFVAARPIANRSSQMVTQGDQPNTEHFLFFECRQKLIRALLNFNSIEAEQVINEALALQSREQVAGKLFTGTICDLEQQWLAGKVHLLTHNYAITTLVSQLVALVKATAMVPSGPKVLLGCAPGDRHEIGLLLLAMSLQRRGFLVVYLGSNLASEGIGELIQMTRPKMVCLSAATAEAVESLRLLSHKCIAEQVVNLEVHQPINEKPFFTFGGAAFNQVPDLINHVSGLYLGNSVESAVAKVKSLIPV